ncbi:MAG: potassium/proton antiporter, partial [Phycisphaerales bacterium]|nr:potassium/proton antiporter [Phycisphaerales bacterium]
MDWNEAILIGAIVSSTDAAAVFGVLRGSGIRLESKLQSTLEVESCANDPMAVILTLAAAEAMARGGSLDARVLIDIPLQLVIGTAVGVGCGFLFRYLINHIRLSATGLYPVLVVAAAFSAFGASTLVYGSGFLAVFVTAVVLGNGHLPFSHGLRRVHDSIAWLSQVLMFLMLGLLVFPSRLLPEALVGIGIGLVLGLVARPLAAAICLPWLGWRFREIALVGWTGLRGAVPIILATFPVMKGLPGADRIFHIVFFVVVVSAVIPGATITFVALRSKMGYRVNPRFSSLELQLVQRPDRDLHEFAILALSPACGKSLRDLDLPESAAIVMILRNDEPFPARGSSVIREGDVLFVVSDERDLHAVRKWMTPGTIA